ncbi:hypothetical protein C8T65DRAFT_288222 [Cerioporus squamosus]|nr:hypothetical protein C8T65DRAFT_288222 [Cerioporus squamosus]
MQMHDGLTTQRHDLPASSYLPTRAHPWIRNLDQWRRDSGLSTTQDNWQARARPLSDSNGDGPICIRPPCLRLPGDRNSWQLGNTDSKAACVHVPSLPAGPGSAPGATLPNSGSALPAAAFSRSTSPRPLGCLKILPRRGQHSALVDWNSEYLLLSPYSWGKVWTSVAATLPTWARISFRPHLRVLLLGTVGEGEAHTRTNSDDKCASLHWHDVGVRLALAEGLPSYWRDCPHSSTEHEEQISSQLSQGSSALLGKLVGHNIQPSARETAVSALTYLRPCSLRAFMLAAARANPLQRPSRDRRARGCSIMIARHHCPEYPPRPPGRRRTHWVSARPEPPPRLAATARRARRRPSWAPPSRRNSRSSPTPPLPYARCRPGARPQCGTYIRHAGGFAAVAARAHTPLRIRTVCPTCGRAEVLPCLYDNIAGSYGTQWRK